MAHKFIHVAFTFSGTPRIKELEPVFTTIGDDWLRYSNNCWILYTPRSASDVFYFLKPHLIGNDHMLIFGIDMNERQGWLPKWIWDWMDKKRQLGPPAPPAPPPLDFGHLGWLGGGLGSGTPFGSGLGTPLNPFDPKKNR